MRGQATLRHAGILVKDLDEAAIIYQALGFKPISREKLEVIKMADEDGKLIELVQGENWHPHIAVNWYSDGQGNYIEVVEGE
mgnify:CR=1 FL=1